MSPAGSETVAASSNKVILIELLYTPTNFEATGFTCARARACVCVVSLSVVVCYFLLFVVCCFFLCFVLFFKSRMPTPKLLTLETIIALLSFFRLWRFPQENCSSNKYKVNVAFQKNQRRGNKLCVIACSVSIR